MPKSPELEMQRPRAKSEVAEDRAQTQAQDAGPASGLEPHSTPPAPAAEPADKKPFYRTTAFRIFFLILLILGIAATVYWLHARNFEETDDAFIDGHVIPISPQVSALVATVNANDNQFVHKGDVLVELDPTDFQAALAQAQGSEAAVKGKLQQAQSDVTSARSAVAEAQAQLDAAQISFENADRQLKRMQQLDERAKSEQQSDDATMTQKTASAQVEQAKARLQSAQSQVATAQASVTAAQGDYTKAQADTNRAQINLGYCKIVAASDGRVTNKNIDPGMYVTPASQMFTIVPADVWVIANFKETQLDLMRPGQKVTIHIDAYPGHDFNGTVDSIQAGTGSRFSVIPSENATGNFVKVVQRVPVKITFDSDTNADTAHLLSPGMSVEPKVRIRDGSY